MYIVFTHMPGESLLSQVGDNSMMTVKIGLVMMIMKRTGDYQILVGHNMMLMMKRTDDDQILVGHNMMLMMKRTDDCQILVGHNMMMMMKRTGDCQILVGHNIMSVSYTHLTLPTSVYV